MNLRQKKKRLKRQVESMRAELEMMTTRPFDVKVDCCKIETLRAVKCVNTRSPVFTVPEDYIYKELNKILITRASEFGCIAYDRYKKYPTIDLFPDEYIYSAELRVVVPDGGDGI